MSYFPDMSSQAAAQGYFEDLIARAVDASPVLRRAPGLPGMFVDAGVVGVPGLGSVNVTPNLGGRGVLAALGTWNLGITAGQNLYALRIGSAGAPTFTIYNDNSFTIPAFWIAVAT